MHIPDAVLDNRVAVATSVLGAAGLAYSLRSVERRLGPRTTPYMGMVAAFLFAAQMVKFPVGPGVSGHLLGGVMAAVLLGPWAGAVVVACMLIIQCFLFGDGGLTVLGANFVNMGLIGSVGGYAIYAPIRRAIGGERGILVGAMAAAWFSVLLAAGACALELSATLGSREFLRVLSWMVLVHAAIGIGEAVITGLVVRFVLLTRPEFLERPIDDGPSPVLADETMARPWLSTTVCGLAVALAIAAFLSPLATELPDGLEFVGEKFGFLAGEGGSPPPTLSAQMPDYRLPLPRLEQVKLATAAAGLVGTLTVFAFGWGLSRAFVGEREPQEVGPDAT